MLPSCEACFQSQCLRTDRAVAKVREHEQERGHLYDIGLNCAFDVEENDFQNLSSGGRG